MESVMLSTQRIIDRRPRGGRHLVGARSRSVKSAAEIKIQGVLDRNDVLPGSHTAIPSYGEFNLPDVHVSPARVLQMNASPQKSITVLVADDHPVVREGLVSLVQRRTDMRVVAEAANGREAVDKFCTERPDVALMDLRMPTMDGIEAVVAICEKDPTAHLVILTSYQSEEDIYRAMRAGAQGYLLKDAPVDELVECIRQVSAGRTWIPSGVGAKLAKRVGDQELTRREMEVLRAVAAGKSNKEIGVALEISEATVKVHVTHILEKLKVTGRTEAINIAAKRGLVRMDVTAAA
jgi:two-component system NarL family response regulator